MKNAVRAHIPARFNWESIGEEKNERVSGRRPSEWCAARYWSGLPADDSCLVFRRINYLFVPAKGLSPPPPTSSRANTATALRPSFIYGGRGVVGRRRNGAEESGEETSRVCAVVVAKRTKPRRARTGFERRRNVLIAISTGKH